MFVATEPICGWPASSAAPWSMNGGDRWVRCATI